MRVSQPDRAAMSLDELPHKVTAGFGNLRGCGFELSISGRCGSEICFWGSLMGGLVSLCVPEAGILGGNSVRAVGFQVPEP